MFQVRGSRFDSAVLRARTVAVVSVFVVLLSTGKAQQPQPDPAKQPASTPAVAAPAPSAELQPGSSPQAGLNSSATAPAQATPAASPADQAHTSPLKPTPSPASAATPKATPAQAPAISEEELKQMLVGKQFYLRGGYLGDSLNFDEHGRILGHPARGSYTLSIIQIDHVRLTKHKVEFEGTRYGLHFNEQLAYEDAASAFDKVRITPKKKLVRITIDREIVVNPKKKESAKEKGRAAKAALAPALQKPGTAPVLSSESDAAVAQPAVPATGVPVELSEADQLKASIAATPEAERPADPGSVTTTTSQAHANKLLRDAVDVTFAPGLDERMMTAMPDFWKLYYQAVASKADYRPADSSILRQNTVDQKAHLLTAFEPESNDFAQTAGVAGMALYHTVIGADGLPGEIAVARPIGFGLDENAVTSIRKAKFSPAVKDGKPVPVMLDLVVQFRIFSKRTGVVSAPETAETSKPAEPVLPGPYSIPHPN